MDNSSPNRQTGREAFDAKVRAELRSIEPPAGLRQRILRDRPAEAPRGVLSVSFWRPVLAAAALVACAAVGWSLFRTPAEDRTLAGFQNRMAGFAVRQYSMDLFTNDLAAVRAYLRQNEAPADFELRGSLAQTSVKGGAKLSWQGKPVAMVCFDGPKEKTLYLFVIDSSAVGQSPAQPLAQPLKGLAAAAWQSGGKTYLLAAELPEAELQAYL